MYSYHDTFGRRFGLDGRVNRRGDQEISPEERCQNAHIQSKGESVTPKIEIEHSKTECRLTKSR